MVSLSIITGYIQDIYNIITIRVRRLTAQEDARKGYLIAFLIPIVGGIGLFLLTRKHDPKLARNYLSVGATYVLVIGILAVVYNIGNKEVISNIETEKQVIQFVQNYSGSMGKGNSVVEVVSGIVNLDYAGQDIADILLRQ